MAITVAVAVGDVGDALVEKLAKKARSIRVGQGLDENADMGPLVTPQHYAKVKAYVDSGVAEGAKLVVDGRDFKLPGFDNGFFIGPCLFDHVTSDMTIYKEEIFGPVLSVMHVSDFETALQLVNDQEYGNGTAIFTRDGGVARAFSRRVQAGMVGINVPIPVPIAFHSFGGWKRSLFGDHHIYGPEGGRFYTRLKTTTTRWPAGTQISTEFVMPTMK